MKTISEFIHQYGLAVYAALFLGLLAGGLLWPSYANQAAAITLGLVMTVAVALVIRGQAAACRQGRLERSSLATNIIIDLLGVLLVTGAALLAGGLAGQAAGRCLDAAGSAWAGILAGLAAGALTGWLAQQALSRLKKG